MTRDRPRWETLSSRLRADRGDLSSGLVMMVFVMLTIALGVHVGLVLHARNVANAAAQDGLRVAQLEGSSPSAGKAAAIRTLELYDGFDSHTVRVIERDDTVEITVSADARGLLDGVLDSFDTTLVGPLERFYGESERR